ncbi:MAG: aromatic amino acid transporter [Pseudomonadales bacterium]
MSNESKAPSSIGGIAIIAGTAVGAGMFSLPIASAGMGFLWAVACLLLTWFCMLHSGLLILETNLNFPVGSSFNTFVGETLGPRWNALNNLSLVFVLYILCYAFISGGGSIVSHTLQKTTGVGVSPALAGLLFSLLIAALVWISTAVVSRVSTILITGMVLSFAYSISQLALGIEPTLLLDTSMDYAIFSLAALPVFLTAFGFHGNIPSLVKFYGKDPAIIIRCIVGGSLVALGVYVVWLAVTLGQLSRDDIRLVMQEGGNIGPMVAAMGTRSDKEIVLTLLDVFANFAVITSFLGAGLGLFDYVADKFGFSDSKIDRFKSAAIAFLPPTLASLVYPNGFIVAIGYAGLSATVWGTLVPAAAAHKSRQQFGNPLFRVWGGNGLLLFMVAYSVLIAACHVLSTLGYLPMFN